MHANTLYNFLKCYKQIYLWQRFFDKRLSLFYTILVETLILFSLTFGQFIAQIEFYLIFVYVKISVFVFLVLETLLKSDIVQGFFLNPD